MGVKKVIKAEAEENKAATEKVRAKKFIAVKVECGGLFGVGRRDAFIGDA